MNQQTSNPFIGLLSGAQVAVRTTSYPDNLADCADQRKGYLYFGLEWVNSCFCGNQLMHTDGANHQTEDGNGHCYKHSSSRI